MTGDEADHEMSPSCPVLPGMMARQRAKLCPNFFGRTIMHNAIAGIIGRLDVRHSGAVKLTLI